MCAKTDVSMRVTKVADSPIFCDKIENTSQFMKKNVVNKNTLRKLLLMGVGFENTNISHHI